MRSQNWIVLSATTSKSFYFLKMSAGGEYIKKAMELDENSMLVYLIFIVEEYEMAIEYYKEGSKIILESLKCMCLFLSYYA